MRITLSALWAISLTDRDELAIHDRPFEVEIPVDLLDRAALATNGWSNLWMDSISASVEARTCATNSGGFPQSADYVVKFVLLAAVGSDACCRKPLICRQLLEQLNNLREICDRLGAPRATRGKARRQQSVVASPVFRPLVLEDRQLRRHGFASS